MTTTPRIEFPCDYPVKVIAEAEEGLLHEVVSIAQRHDPTLVMTRVTERMSRNGAYNAITIQLWATGEGQLQRLFEELKECQAVRMVL
ncbi:MAG: DUF493 domain-containing protein [Pseudomonadales bacterium]|nr:DUF493 domain-containing protein [Pseudomonadales bacterium]